MTAIPDDVAAAHPHVPYRAHPALNISSAGSVWAVQPARAGLSRSIATRSASMPSSMAPACSRSERAPPDVANRNSAGALSRRPPAAGLVISTRCSVRSRSPYSTSRASSNMSRMVWLSVPSAIAAPAASRSAPRRTPSPRSRSVVGHAHTMAAAAPRSCTSRSLMCVACTAVRRSSRIRSSASSSTGRTPYAATHSSISAGCSLTCMWNGRSRADAHSCSVRIHSRGTARRLCGATPTVTPSSRSAFASSASTTWRNTSTSRVSNLRCSGSSGRPMPPVA
jgi:hypothetical protein